MKNLKVVDQQSLKDWAKEIFQKNSFNMVDVSSKKETFRRALASGKIYVGKEVFELIKNKEMPKGDPITLAEVSAVLGVKKTSELIPLCHPLPIDHTATKIIMNEMNREMRRMSEREERLAKKADRNIGKYNNEKVSRFKRISNYMGEVRTELKRVNWPSTQILSTFTIVTIVTIITMTLLIFGMDFGFKNTLISMLSLGG